MHITSSLKYLIFMIKTKTKHFLIITLSRF